MQARVLRWLDGHTSVPARDVLWHYTRRGLLLIAVEKEVNRMARAY